MTWLVDDVLAIGSLHSAVDVHALCKGGISAVFNVARELDVAIPNPGGLEYVKYGIDETTTTAAELGICVDILDALRHRNLPTLVHCYAGISRSVIVCALHLRIHPPLSMPRPATLYSVMDYIADKRHKIDPAPYLVRRAHELLEQRGVR